MSITYNNLYMDIRLYAFLTIQLDDVSIMDFIKRAVKFFITTQQNYVWKERNHN